MKYLPPGKMMGIESNGMLLSMLYNYEGEEALNFILLDDNIPAGAKVYQLNQLQCTVFTKNGMYFIVGFLQKFTQVHHKYTKAAVNDCKSPKIAHFRALV